MALKLIAKQLEKLYQEIPEECGFSAGPLEDDMLHWEASILGPEDSPYHGGRFWLRIDFTADYPFRPPKIIFLTKVFHPNVEPDGKICIDFLQDEWKPSYTIGYLLMAICSLLLHPHPDNPAHQEAANMYLSDPEKFKQTAEEWTKLHAPLDVWHQFPYIHLINQMAVTNHFSQDIFFGCFCSDDLISCLLQCTLKTKLHKNISQASHVLTF